MRAESAVQEGSASEPTGSPTRQEVLGGRWALLLGGALVLLLAAAEGAHGYARARTADFERVVQRPVPISSPASHPEVSAPDPGDDP